MFIIGEKTISRLERRLKKFGLPVTEKEFIWCDGCKRSVALVKDAPSMGTNLEKGIFCYNNPDGKFFIDKGDEKSPVRLGKILRKVFGVTNPQEIEKMIREWERYYLSPKDVLKEMLPSEAYDCPHGDLGSCMIRCGEFYERLEEIADVFCLVYMEGDIVMGRALVWKQVLFKETPVGNDVELTFMDKIYADRDMLTRIENMFIKHAREKGWVYKYAQSSHSSRDFLIWIDDKEVAFSSLAVVPLRESYGVRQNQSPYLDTFYSLTGDEKYLVNDWICSLKIGDHQVEDTCYELRATGGHIGYECTECGEWFVDEDEALELGDGTWVCPLCASHYVWCDDIQDYAHEEDAVYCEDTNCWFRYPEEIKSLVFCETDWEYHYFKNCVFCVDDDKWYLKDDETVVFCESDGEYHLRDNPDLYYCDGCGAWYFHHDPCPCKPEQEIVNE